MEYDFDGDVKMQEVEENQPSMSRFFVAKPFTNHAVSKCAAVTKYVEVTVEELYQKVQ